MAVYSEADKDGLHVKMVIFSASKITTSLRLSMQADEAYCIGPPPSTESYVSD